MASLRIILLSLTCFPVLCFADKGFDAYRKGNFEEAQAAYMEKLAKGGIDLDRGQLHLNLGAAAYRGNDYEGAKHAFGQALLSNKPSIQEKAHYNLGNALFQTGRELATEDVEETRTQWDSAIKHYQSALELNAQNSQAQKNLEFVKVQLENLKPPEQEQNEDEQQEQDDQENPDNNDQQDDQNEPPPPPEQEEDDPPSSPPPPDDPQNSPDQEQPQPPPPTKPEERDWSPDDARRILENNADEDKDVKPETMEQFSSEPFRNW